MPLTPAPIEPPFRCAAIAFACAAALLAAAPGAWAQPAAPAAQEVVITGSVSERAAFEAPHAVGLVGAEAIRAAGPMVNLSEVMARVPGLVVSNRHNYAQDLQISARGFGARAGFGVRGVRLYTDGIPASMPDGQGQVSHFDLAGAQRIEVLRGPFSVLYGNSSGGVIAAVTAPVARRMAEGGLDLGSFGLRQVRAQLASPLGGGIEARAAVSALRIEGFRPHAEAQKKTAALRVAFQGADDRLVLIANALDQPADDPLGLTREQFEADPFQTTPQATQFDTRKETRQVQAGLAWRHRFTEALESRVTAYTGRRDVTQWLAIAASTQANPRHGGGVIDFARRYEGLDLRLSGRVGEALEWAAGFGSERQRDDRQGYENFVGATLGVTGALRRDEENRAATDDAYAQVEWRFAPAWRLSGGVRSGRVALAASDRFLANGDDSGERRFRYTNPVLGVRFEAARNLALFASAARGFESPTLGELAYRADGTSGFNAGLQPQQSRQFEAGAKWREGGLAVDATLFSIRVENEIGVQTNAGGRASFQNIGRTKRSGAELAARWQATPAWRGVLAVSTLSATTRDGFLACAGIPCSAPSVPVPAGNRLAGTMRGSAFAEVAWDGGAWGEWAVEARAASPLVANDTNTAAAAGHGLVHLRWQKGYALGAGVTMDVLLRIDNAFDKVHAGSVIVNDANGRFFETGAPRGVLLGLKFRGG